MCRTVAPAVPSIEAPVDAVGVGVVVAALVGLDADPGPGPYGLVLDLFANRPP